MAWSNWINVAILLATALVGVLSWLGARKAANEANDIQKRLLAIEESRFSREDATTISCDVVNRIPTNPKSERDLIIENLGRTPIRELRGWPEYPEGAEPMADVTAPLAKFFATPSELHPNSPLRIPLGSWAGPRDRKVVFVFEWQGRDGEMHSTRTTKAL